MTRLSMPAVDKQGLQHCIEELIRLEKEWIPKGDGFSLYIRPTAISTSTSLGVGPPADVKVFVILSPVGPYYSKGFKPVSLYASDE